MSQYRHLLSPLELRGRRFRNRVLSTGHAPGYAEQGSPGERYQAYHEEKARGGIGLTIFGGSSNISRDSGSIYGQIYVGSDAIIPVFQTFAQRIHAHGAGLMCQITHMGRRTAWNSGDWLPTLGPSALRDPAHHAVPRAMSTADIQQVVDNFAAAAWRCREGGLDGCEILATTHLLGQFLSPLSNQREDNYGGSLANRGRFLLEVLAACRERVGDEFIIGVRFAADESNEGGMGAEEGIQLATLLGQQGAVDFLNVNGAYGGTEHGLAETFPGMAFKAAPYVHLAAQVRRASGLAVFQAARLSDPATADWAIGEGLVDMAGLTRPHMADPHLVAKLQRGEEARIRPCVGAGYCIDRIYGGRDALCLHNVSTGRETHLPHTITVADQPRRVAIIGAGPAGLEAARVCALRGHQVELYEAAPKPGGQLLLAARGSWRQAMIGISDWLVQEVEQLGVILHCNRFLDGPEVLDTQPEVVIIATGGIPDPGLAETDASLVHSTWDLLSGEVSPAEQVLLYDETGSHAALSTADWLAQQGVQVELVTPDHQVGRAIGGQNLPVYLRHLYRHGTRLSPDHRLKSVRREGNTLRVVLWNEYARVEVERQTLQVVVERATVPADEPFQLLCAASRNLGHTDVEALLNLQPQPQHAHPAGRYALYRIGDAVASRDVHAALLDANRLCRVL